MTRPCGVASGTTLTALITGSCMFTSCQNLAQAPYPPPGRGFSLNTSKIVVLFSHRYFSDCCLSFSSWSIQGHHFQWAQVDFGKCEKWPIFT